MMGLTERVKRNDPSMKLLCTRFNRIEDISFMSSNTHVSSLELYGEPITDLQPLEFNTCLSRLHIEFCHNLSDLSPLRHTGPFAYLVLCRNKIDDVSPLCNVKVTLSLNLGKNQIRDISPLSNTTAELLQLHDNDISDLSPLWGNTHISFLTTYHNPRIPLWQKNIIHRMVEFNRFNRKLRTISLRQLSITSISRVPISQP